ncbi:MAG: DUF6152 family protein [Steroidobacteraceae bacterium]
MKHIKLWFPLLLLPLAAQAHHSFAIYDSTHQVTIEGTVKEFQWTNPHVWIHVMVKNDKGAEEEWAVECTSVNFLQRRGWTKRTFKTGDKVSITLSPLRDGSNGGSFRTVNTINGVVPKFETEE